MDKRKDTPLPGHDSGNDDAIAQPPPRPHAAAGRLVISISESKYDVFKV